MNHVEQQIDELIDKRQGFAAMEPATQGKAIQLHERIWMSPGTSNAYMVLTDAGRVIINTGMGFEALAHKAAFDTVCSGPTPYIVLTQGHVDHVGGVAHFRSAETQVIAQQNNATCQRDDERIQKVRSAQAYIWFRKTIDSAIAVARENPQALVQDKPVPDLCFNDSYHFCHGGVMFDIFATPGGETIDSCVVWLPQYRILFSGNVFGPLFPHFPNINTIRGDKYRSIDMYLSSLRRVRELAPDVLVTGHFEPISGAGLIRGCLDRLEAAVDFVHTQTLQGMNNGKDIFTLMREVQLPPHLRVGEGYGKVSWAVRTIWETYMGWFKAQATSELYPVRPADSFADLVELAGMDAVIQRATTKLHSGDIEQALVLSEAALVYNPQHTAALQLALEVHRALLARSSGSNFWEAGWLQHKIDHLQKLL